MCSAVTAAPIVLPAAPDAALALSDEIVLKIGAHLSRQTSTMLVKQFSRDEWEVVQLRFLVRINLFLFLKTVIKLFLVVKE